MAIMIPSELAGLLSVLGYDWPQSNEDKLMDLGQAWNDFAGELTDVGGEAGTQASRTWDEQVGRDIDAFKTWWEGEDGPPHFFESGSMGAMAAGTGMMICSVMVLGLKIMVIVQLAILAVQIAIAIAQAAITFGASLLQVPIFKQITGEVLGVIIDQVVSRLLEA